MTPRCKADRCALSTHKYGRIRLSQHACDATMVRPDSSDTLDCGVKPGPSISIDGLLTGASGDHPEIPANSFRLLRSKIHHEVTGIHTSGVGGHSPCRAYWSDVEGFRGLADPISTTCVPCTGDYATAGGVRLRLPGSSPSCSLCHKPQAWANFNITGGRSMAKKGAER